MTASTSLARTACAHCSISVRISASAVCLFSEAMVSSVGKTGLLPGEMCHPPHLDGAAGGQRGNAFGDRDGFFEVPALDEMDASQLFFGLGERPVGGDPPGVSLAHGGGGRARFQSHRGDEVAAAGDALLEFSVVFHDLLPPPFRQVLPSFLVKTAHQRELHGFRSFTASRTERDPIDKPPPAAVLNAPELNRGT